MPGSYNGSGITLLRRERSRALHPERQIARIAAEWTLGDVTDEQDLHAVSVGRELFATGRTARGTART